MKNTYSSLNTPAYVFDTEVLKDHLDIIQNILSPETELCFAMKANPFLIDALSDRVSHIEVCSFGEFKIVERSSVPIESIILSGVYKNKEETEYIVRKYGSKLLYTIESKEQFQILQSLSKQTHQHLRVLLRLSSGNQFGMSKEDLYEVAKDIAAIDSLLLYGIHFFSGTQKDSPTKYERELSKLYEIITDFEERYNFYDLAIEYGPGFSVDYFNEDSDEQRYAQIHKIKEVLDNLHLADRVTLEAGRFFTAYCGSYVTDVVDVKKINDSNLCIVDGGIHHLSYYGQNMALKQPPIRQEKETLQADEKAWTIFGSLCTTSDVLARNVQMKNLEIGTRLIFDKVGAYSVTEGISLFLSHSLPSVYLYENESFKWIRKPIETHEFNYVEESL